MNKIFQALSCRLQSWAGRESVRVTTNAMAVVVIMIAWGLALLTDHIGIAWGILLVTWIVMRVIGLTRGYPFDWLFRSRG